MSKCPKCGGSGACPVCYGLREALSETGASNRPYEKCKACSGNGACAGCKGTGRLPEHVATSV